MIGMATLPQIRAQVANLLRRSPEARVIAIRTGGGWAGDAKFQVGEREFRARYCSSELAMREALLQGTDGSGLVLVTPLDESSLGQDLVARFARRRVHSVEAWTILKDVFQAREVDPSLLRKPWLAEAVLEMIPPEGVPPVPSGVLDAETVWGMVLRRHLNFRSSRPDDLDVLRWSTEAGSLSRYAGLSDEMRKAVREWIMECAGKSSQGVFACVEAGNGLDAFPAGLAMTVLSVGAAHAPLTASAARLDERFAGGTHIQPPVAAAWADAAGRLFDHLDSTGSEEQLRGAVDRSDQILREILAAPFAYLSDYSRLGFEMRLENFGQALIAALDQPSTGLPANLIEQADLIKNHCWASRFPQRANQVEMAIRLLRWFSQPTESPLEQPIESLEDLAASYAREGGFVDWARQTLFFGDSVQTLSTAYGRLCGLITQRREAQSKSFAHRLADWTAASSTTRSAVLIEDVLKSVVAPLARVAPVLLVVVDGMSFAVFRELIQDISTHGWLELSEQGKPAPGPVIAALPSITEVCRRSLLAGRLMSGTGDDERQAFAANPDLGQAVKSAGPPILFQKSELADPGGASLALDVRKEIASAKRRVVAAIVNAVDDHLLKGEQVFIPWTLGHIPLLNQLLGAAMEAGRVVVMTSDHGHVLDHDTAYRASNLGERYRGDDVTIHADEVRISGTRVVLPPEGTLIVPWSEKVRYGGKRNGYHGGASPQECVVPLAILGWQSMVPDGYQAVPLYRPQWWQSEVPAQPVLVAVKSGVLEPSTLEPKYSPKGQAELPFVPSKPRGTWIDRLLQSPVFQRQLEQAGRAAPTQEKLRNFLQALDERGGTMLRAALAQKLGEPELRMPGIVAAVRRVLNVEGYSVLSVDEASGSVVLNKQLLEVQFELDRAEESHG
jgi:hypothetical protein